MNYKKKAYELGKRGEMIAKNYLKKHNYSIVMENFRIPGGEIDIIAKNKCGYVFFEVKTRKSNSFGPPEEAFNTQKQKYLDRAIKCFFSEISGNYYSDWHCDLISIYFYSNCFGWLKHYVDVLQE